MWDEMSTDIAVTPRKSEVVSFRLPSDELIVLRWLHRRLETISEFLEGQLAERMLGPGRILPELDLMASRGSVVPFHWSSKRRSL